MPSGNTMPSRPPGLSRFKHRSMNNCSVGRLPLTFDIEGSPPIGSRPMSNSARIGVCSETAVAIRSCAACHSSP